MTKKDFIILAIKLFALYHLIQTVYEIFTTVSYFAFDEFTLDNLKWNGVIILLNLVFYLLILYYASRIVKLFRIGSENQKTMIEFDTKSEEQMDFKGFTISGFTKASIILLGLFIIIQNIPSFITFCYFSFKRASSGNLQGRDFTDLLGDIGPDPYYVSPHSWMITSLGLILGFILVMRYEKISSWIVNSDSEKIKNID